MSNQTKNINLNYLTDPAFITVNRLFMLLFEDEDDRLTFPQYYTPKAEVRLQRAD